MERFIRTVTQKVVNKRFFVRLIIVSIKLIKNGFFENSLIKGHSKGHRFLKNLKQLYSNQEPLFTQTVTLQVFVLISFLEDCN